ncbi:MAG: hypothetical protein WC365_08025 [Candidatus Babeliales bacterium]|jgi:hypothetical protein
MTYGLADLAAPYIQYKGTLGDCFRASRGLGLCGIYKKDKTGAWVTVAKRYFDNFTHTSKIKNI